LIYYNIKNPQNFALAFVDFLCFVFVGADSPAGRVGIIRPFFYNSLF